MKKTKKILAYLLAAAMLTALLPMTALAAVGDTFSNDCNEHEMLTENETDGYTVSLNKIFTYAGNVTAATTCISQSPMKGGCASVSKMLKVTPNDDYTLLVEFEHGNKILFNMRDMIKTMPYSSLENLDRFRDITLEEKAIRWPDPVPGKSTVLPIRLTVDNMLFAIRE